MKREERSESSDERLLLKLLQDGTLHLPVSDEYVDALLALASKEELPVGLEARLESRIRKALAIKKGILERLKAPEKLSSFGRYLRLRLEAAGTSQAEAAESLGVPDSALAALMEDRIDILREKPVILRKIVDRYGPPWRTALDLIRKSFYLAKTGDAREQAGELAARADFKTGEDTRQELVEDAVEELLIELEKDKRSPQKQQEWQELRKTLLSAIGEGDERRES